SSRSGWPSTPRGSAKSMRRSTKPSAVTIRTRRRERSSSTSRPSTPTQWARLFAPDCFFFCCCVLLLPGAKMQGRNVELVSPHIEAICELNHDLLRRRLEVAKQGEEE